MATYRKVHTSFWQDPYVLSLTPEGKFFYLYLLTNTRTNMVGVYEMPIQVVCLETGYNRETVEKLIASFVDSEKIKYDQGTCEVLLLNWLKHNWSDSPKILECIHKDAETIKSTMLYEYCINTIEILKHTKTKTKTKHKTKHKTNMGDLFDEKFCGCAEFVAAWELWENERSERGNPITERSAKMQAKFLSGYSPEDAAFIIETSIANSWTGLFPPKQQTINAIRSKQADDAMWEGMGQ